MSEMNASDAPRFEARYTPTRELLREAYTVTQPAWYLILAGLITLYALGLGIYYIVLMLQIPGESILLGVMMVLLGVGYGVFFFLLRPGLMAGKRIKAYREVYGGETDCYRFFDDHFQINDSTGGTLTVPYEKITKVTQTKHLILLRRAQRLYHPLEKAGFTQGTPEQFLSFLKEKAPQAKGLR